MDRPMWLAVDASSDRVVLSAHDGDTTGQKIRVDADWLADRGIQDPLVHHEDGTVLDVTASPSGGTYIVDVPHFSDIIIEDPTLDESWKTESFTRYYDADGPVGAFPFNISVSDVTEGNMTLRYWDEDNGTHTAFDGEVFNKTTRESLNRSGYYSLNFINETNVDNLEATLGTSLWNLTDVTLTSYVFTNPASNLTYHFDKDEGWIRKVTDAGNGAEVVVSSTATGGEGYPTSGPLSGPAVVDLTTGVGLDGEATFDDFDSSNHASVTIDWSGGDADETAQGSVLSSDTHVVVKADYFLEVIIDTYGPNDDKEPCFEVSDCHVRSKIDWPNDLGVRFPDGPKHTGTVILTCGGDCTWNSALGQWDWASQGQLTLEDDVDHGLLGDEVQFPFWYCASAESWDRDGGRSTTPEAQDVECEVQFHKPSTRSGTITIDPTLL